MENGKRAIVTIWLDPRGGQHAEVESWVFPEYGELEMAAVFVHAGERRAKIETMEGTRPTTWIIPESALGVVPIGAGIDDGVELPLSIVGILDACNAGQKVR